MGEVQCTRLSPPEGHPRYSKDGHFGRVGERPTSYRSDMAEGGTTLVTHIPQP